MMNSLTEDLWIVILSRLPLKIITTSKLVCKQWKSLIESPFLRELFLSHHQNSHSSWSIMCTQSQKEIVAHYGCEIWGLPRSLGSYISSFLTDKFETLKEKQQPIWLPKPKARVVAYTDVGLILISLKYSPSGSLTYYVANPISQQCVEIPYLPQPAAYPFIASGLVTRIENDVVLGYKVVLMDTRNSENSALRLHIYSSETRLWSFGTLNSPCPLHCVGWFDPVSLNGKLYWLRCILDTKEVVLSHDFYAESDGCSVLHFPDLEIEREESYTTACTTSQGDLMYINLCKDKNEGGLEHKLSVWRLKRGEWQLVSEIFPACIKTGNDYFPLAINPFDVNTLYLWSQMHKCLASTNVHKGKFGLHNNLEHCSNGRTLSFAGEWDSTEQVQGLSESYFSTFALPRWLYRIPSHSQMTSLSSC